MEIYYIKFHYLCEKSKFSPKKIYAYNISSFWPVLYIISLLCMKDEFFIFIGFWAKKNHSNKIMTHTICLVSKFLSPNTFYVLSFRCKHSCSAQTLLTHKKEENRNEWVNEWETSSFLNCYTRTWNFDSILLLYSGCMLYNMHCT